MNYSHYRQQTGFTLMEAMLALLIFSVGLLGLVGMQLYSLKNNDNAMKRTNVVTMTYDMVEKISAIGDTVPPADKAAWIAGMAKKLPGGTATIENSADIVVGTTSAKIVTIYWDEDNTGATGTNCPPKSASDLRCFRFTVMPASKI